MMGMGTIIDVETTGLSPKTDEIIEISLVLFSFERKNGLISGIVDQYTGLRKPSVPINPFAARVHGITESELRDKTLDLTRIHRIMDRTDFFIAHNAVFDRGFVTKMFGDWAKKPWLCSMKGIDWYGKGVSSRSLGQLTRYYNISMDSAHRANCDALAVLHLLSCQNQNGVTFLAELLKCEYGKSESAATIDLPDTDLLS